MKREPKGAQGVLPAAQGRKCLMTEQSLQSPSPPTTQSLTQHGPDPAPADSGVKCSWSSRREPQALAFLLAAQTERVGVGHPGNVMSTSAQTEAEGRESSESLPGVIGKASQHEVTYEPQSEQDCSRGQAFRQSKGTASVLVQKPGKQVAPLGFWEPGI